MEDRVYEDEREESALRRAVRAAWRRRWLATAVFSVLAVVAVSVIAALPNVYQSASTVLVELQQMSEDVVKPITTSEVETRLRSISEQIVSRQRLLQVINEFDLYPDLRGRVPEDTILTRMKRNTRLELKGVERKRRGEAVTIAFTVSYRGRQPETVATVTNTLVSSYLEENRRIRRRQAKEAASFLEGQLREATQRLAEQDRKLIGFKRRHIGDLPEQLGANMGALEQLHSQLRMNAANQIRATERRVARMQDLAEAQSLQQRRGGREGELTRLRRELAALAAVTTPRYPDVARLRAQIAAFEAMGDEPEEPEPTVLLRKGAVADADAELRALNAEEVRLKQAIAMFENRVAQTPTLEQELRGLSHDYDSSKEFVKSLQKRYGEVQLGVQVERYRTEEELRVIDSAIPAAMPSGPNRSLLAAVGVLLAMGVAGAAVALREAHDGSFHDAEEVRSLASLPIAVRVPVIAGGGFAPRRALRVTVTAVFVVGLLAIGMASYRFARHDQNLLVILDRVNGE
jgi:polysaccharide chain length determinant protein (PEP-CTERM system associated)